jgi:O-acetyl-ADP-ribose deacetylase (regulator of RNase III)
LINLKNGDVFRAKEDVFVHGCNCWNVMGAGVALEVVKRYPAAYYDGDLMTVRGDENKLGTYTKWEGKHFLYDQPITVVNAYTQFYPNPDIKPLDYDALETVMVTINAHFYDKSICMPRIGAGLAGGDWNRILEILEEVFKNRKDVTVYSL